MNLRQVALALCLVPIISFGNDGTSRREELEKLQFEKLSEIAHLSKQIDEEHESYFHYKYIALQYWNPTNKEEKESSLDLFTVKLTQALDNSKDFSAMIDKTLFTNNSIYDLELTFTRLALQNLLLEKLSAQYKQLLKDFIVITKDLNTSKN